MVAPGVAANPREIAEAHILRYNHYPALQVPRLSKQSDLCVRRHCEWIVFDRVIQF